MSFVHLQDNDGDSALPRPAGAIVVFSLFITVGMLALACAVLLPEYAALDDLQAKRDAVAHQVECNEKLLSYNNRMIYASRNDPVLIARLMIRHGNYHPAGYETVESSASQQSVPERLLQEAANPPKRRDQPVLVRAGLWLTDTTTERCVILLAIVMIVTGMVIFPRRQQAG